MNLIMMVAGGALLTTGFFFGATLILLTGGGRGRGAFRRRAKRIYEIPGRQLIDELRYLFARIDKQLARHGEQFVADVASAGQMVGELPETHKRFIESLIQAKETFQGELRRLAAEADAVQRRFEAPSAPRDREPTSRTREGSQNSARSAGAAAPKADPEATNLAGVFATGVAAGQDRRHEKRHPFFCEQWMAPYNGHRLPEAGEFEAVQCRDISASGISFFLDRPPDFELLIVRLVKEDECKFLTARVQRITPSGNPEFGSYVVGCRFLGTIHGDAMPKQLNKLILRQESQGHLAPSRSATACKA